jgi:hypothetical protein
MLELGESGRSARPRCGRVAARHDRGGIGCEDAVVPSYGQRDKAALEARDRAMPEAAEGAETVLFGLGGPAGRVVMEGMTRLLAAVPGQWNYSEPPF